MHYCVLKSMIGKKYYVGLLTLSEIIRADKSFSKPLRETDLSFSSNHIIGELNSDFESIPFDIIFSAESQPEPEVGQSCRWR